MSTRQNVVIVVEGDHLLTDFGEIVSHGRALTPAENALLTGPTTRDRLIELGFPYDESGPMKTPDGKCELISWVEAD